MEQFPQKVREKLRHYVYVYVDPRTDEPFYIGKGKGNRVFAHLKDRSESDKVRVIDELAKLGLEPRIELLKHDLTEQQALLVESTAIDLLDIDNLTNLMRGHGSRHGGRATVDEVVATIDAQDAIITEPTMLIVINRAFRYGMTPQELYDATRSCWKLGTRREKAQYAMAIYHGIVREVYVIAGWVPGGSTMRSDDEDGRHEDMPTRWEFIGKVADDSVRQKYLGKSVAHHYKRAAQNPIMYVNC